jgi:hypothetical protein
MGPSNQVWREIRLKQVWVDLNNRTQKLAMETSSHFGDARALQYEWMNWRNRPRTKYIERSGWKLISHLEVEETERLAERMREGVPMEEDYLGGDTLLSLGRSSCQRWGRKKERRGRQRSGV